MIWKKKLFPKQRKIQKWFFFVSQIRYFVYICLYVCVSSKKLMKMIVCYISLYIGTKQKQTCVWAVVSSRFNCLVLEHSFELLFHHSRSTNDSVVCLHRYVFSLYFIDLSIMFRFFFLLLLNNRLILFVAMLCVCVVLLSLYIYLSVIFVFCF